MNIPNAISWATTWLALSLLKLSTRYRLKGEGAKWLQSVGSNQPGIFNRVDFILALCVDKQVLHIGFTDHPFTTDRLQTGDLLHLNLMQVTADLAGVDNEENAISEYSRITADTQVFYADITVRYPAEAIAFNPALILLSEVLEHLKDPYKAIEVLYESFDAGTVILVTVPNYTALDSLAASGNRTESIHPYHHWYFSPYTLCRLFDDNRFKLLQLNFGMYYKRGTRINRVLKENPFNGDCIMATFVILKNAPDA